MKQVVLAEGKRDVKLVEQYYERQSEDVRVKRFIGEEVEHSRLKNEESEAITNFLERRNPYQVLAKSENGKPDLKRVFTKLVNTLLHRNLDLCLLVDLDTRSYDRLIADLDERVRSNYSGNTFEISRVELIDESSAQLAARNQLIDDGRTVGTFTVLAFRSNLEKAANVADEDSEAAEAEKLRKFLADSRRSSPMRQVL